MSKLQQFKTGKLPAKYDPKLIHLSDIQEATALTQAQVGYDSTTGMNTDWGMLGNDRYGDCVWAGADHETEILTHDSATEASFGSDSDDGSKTALADYAACTGFNPNDPNTDQGTDMGNAMSYRRHTGIVDANGNRHKVGAYVALEPGNWTQLLEALYAFRVVGIGIEFPTSAMDQFNAGKPWTVVRGASVEGGHYIPCVGRATATYLEVLTWAKKIRMSKAFFEKYNDESFVFVSTEDLINNKSPQGYSISQLNTILKEVKAA